MNNYDQLVSEVINKAGEQLHDILCQPDCEYIACPNGFMGFLDVYDAVRSFVPKERTIVDLGCYLAAQAFLFDDYKKYVGVDVVDMKRFETNNSLHFMMSIQEFVKKHGDEYKDAFAVCAYVPDREAADLVRHSFADCLVYYPRSVN